ncbi:MAG: FtsX-like permease family protein [Planctomycetota bacterium]
MWKRPLQPLLGLCAIAMGTAVVVGVDTANRSATLAFDEAVTTLGGSATHAIVGDALGIEEEWLPKLRTELGVRSATPVLEGTGRLLIDGEPADTLRLRGVDPLIEGQLRPWFDGQPGGSTVSLTRLLLEPRAVVLSERTAERLGLEVEDEFTLRVAGRPTTFRLCDRLRVEDESTNRSLDEVVWMDLATAQEVLDRIGLLDRIDLEVSENEAQAIEELLPPRLQLESADAQRGALARLTRAFRFNLAALAALALLVGAFLIHQAIQFRVVQRRENFAILRSIGATRGQILRAVLLEATILSAFGAILGTVLGLLMAEGLLSVVTTTIRELYSPLAVERLRPSVWSLALWAGCATAAGVLAAIPPSLEATRTHPEAATRRTTLERPPKTRRVVLLQSAAIASIGLVSFATESLWAAYVTILAVLLAVALGVPAITGVMLSTLRPLFGRIFGVEGKLAVRSAEGGLSRTGLATTALAIAVATTLGVELMVGSFRTALDSWLGVTLNADIYASVPSHMSSRTSVRMDDEALTALQEIDGVVDWSTYRRVSMRTDRGSIEFASLGTTENARPGLEIVDGPEDAVETVFGQASGLLISKPLARRTGLSIGDRVAFPDYDDSVVVLAVFRDYATERGYAFWSESQHRTLTGDDAVSSLALWLDPSADGADVLRRAREAVADNEQSILVRSTPELREASLKVFDRTFAITDVLRFLCVIVAFVGTVAALLALQLERRIELALLRAIGATPNQVARSVIWQNLALGLCAGVLAIPIGILLAWLFVGLIQPRSFGWSLPGVEVSAASVASAPMLAILAALLAAIWPALRSRRTLIAQNLHDE